MDDESSPAASPPGHAAHPGVAGGSAADVLLGCGAALVAALDHLDGRSWSRPSALEAYSVGGLAAHAARALTTTAAYLDAPGPPRDAGVVDAAGYLVGVLGEDDPVDSDLHRGVRARADAAAAAGPAAVAEVARQALEALRRRLPTERGDRPLAVRDGIAITLDEYLRTRVVEVVVHLDDLAASADGIEAIEAEVGEDAWVVAAEVLAATAVRRAGGRAVVRSLARAERHPDAVRAL